AIIITSESIFAAIFSALLYGERMTLRGYLGCIIIFVAMALAEQKKSVDKANKIE
ncbi:MAG: EamA family transporter, partial [Anaerotignum sp.]|nr:EamA family transporter [Anaerotignum sp.]